MNEVIKDITELLSQRHPGKRVFVMSDHHFFHENIIKYCRNEFAGLEEMHNKLIKAHNSVINEEDIVIFLGDFCFRNSEILEINKRLNGTKYIILGNHDRDSLCVNFERFGFNGVFTTPVKFDNFYLSHYPLYEELIPDVQHKHILQDFKKLDVVNIHGHTHDDDMDDSRFYNVSGERINYTPCVIGKTKVSESSLAFVNSLEFSSVISDIASNSRYTASFLVEDYVYSCLLNKINEFKDNMYCYGSFAMWADYGYVSKMSDIDLGFIPSEKLSGKKNQNLNKEIVETAYNYLNRLHYSNTSYYKRTGAMRIIDGVLNYPTFNGEVAFDMNYIKLQVYKDSDFVINDHTSLLERIVTTEKLGIDVDFPKYSLKTLNTNAMIANHLIQLCFQDMSKYKIDLITKKIRCLMLANKNFDQDEINDVFFRYLLRTVSMFDQLNRESDICAILNTLKSLEAKIYSLSPFIRKLLLPVLGIDALDDISTMIINDDVKDGSKKLILNYK